MDRDGAFFTRDSRFALKPADGKPGMLSGYAMVWNALSSDRGGFVVRLQPGSAKPAPTTFALYNHEYADPLGRVENNTLRLFSDDTGVRVEIDLPDTQAGRDVATLVRRGDVGGMSFFMADVEDAAEVVENGVTIFDVKSFTYDEGTVTAVPAFKATNIAHKFSQFRKPDARRDARTHLHRSRSLQLNP